MTLEKKHAMKKITIIVLTFLTFCSAVTLHAAEDSDKLFSQANAAYDSGDYLNAAALYNQLLSEGWQGWELYYNLGNAYYRLDEIGNALLSYERALRLAPNKKVVKDNLALARSKTVDNIEELPRLFIVEWTQAVVNLTTPRGWRTMLLVLVVLFCVAAYFFFVAKDYRLRKAMFITGSALALLILISAVDATISANNVTKNNEAIVTAPLIVVKGSPDAKSVDKFILHEGTKLTITDRQDDWWQIEIADGKSGWVNGGSEII